jgi:serine/threonine protein kinase/Tol biopolymer transport system component
MGEVYRARDTKLNRDVAIKVLLPAVANDPDRLARFSREAQVLASLNHPNIAHIYGVEDAAIVMELVEGDDLAQRLARGPIPLDEALPIARQIAEALEAAHDHGIIHRDLKPANIKLRADGTVKVLDFGLAKAIDPTAGSSAAAMNSPTLSIQATEAGIILGTAAYMSPEQARGKPVDKRTDIWALGCVLFEMLTGARAFKGDEATDTIVAVVSKEPDWSALPRAVPAGIQRLLRRTLEKDPRRRLDSAAAVRIEIDDASNLTNPTNLTIPTNPAKPWRLLPLGVAAALAIAAGILWRAFDGDRATLAPSISRFAVQPPIGTRILGRFEISPDGSQLAYAAVERGATRLFLRRLDQFEATALPGTDRGAFPFFSPDGKWLAFIVGNKLQKIDLTAMAAPVVLGTVDRPLGVTWPAADTIIYAEFQRGLSSMSAEGGAPHSVTKLSGNSEEVDHHNPVLLPGGQAVLFTVHEGKEQFSIAVQSLASGERKVLIASGFDARYSATGHLVYGSEHAILAVPFDLTRLEVTGAPVTLVDHVATNPLTGIGSFRLSATGSLAYQPEQPIAGRTLAWLDRSGAETLLRIPPRGFTSPRVSPDGKRLAFAAADGERRDVWFYELATDQLNRLTLDGTNGWPLWTPDGRHLTYVSMRGRTQHLVWQPIDGSGPAVSLVSGSNTLTPGSWTPGNHGLVYVDSPPNGFSDVLLLRPGSESRPQPAVKKTDAVRGNRSPSLSPDGRWLAYTSNETGRLEIYVAAFPASGTRHLVTVDGGDEPVWARDGRELFFRRARTLFGVPVRTAGEFSAGKPVRLFDVDYPTLSDALLGDLNYDVAPDGRFVIVKPSEEEKASPHLNVVLNWTSELVRRVPVNQPR